MKTSSRITAIIVLTPVLAAIIYFLVYTSVDPHWGGGYWEQWLMVRTGLGVENAHFIVFWVRKTSHFCGYGSLGLLFWLYFFLWRVKPSLIIGLVATALVALGDEYQQSLSTFRSGQSLDVVIDILGAMVFCGVYRILFLGLHKTGVSHR